MKVLITGGAGFIGSHLVRYMLKTYPDYEIINLDNLTYAGRLDNLSDIEDNPNYKFVKGDIADPLTVESLMEGVDYVINAAAETHVDRSIESSSPFIHSNVIGTQVMLDVAKKNNVKRFLQISTDEVYGDIAEGFFTEESPLKPSNPYSASKAAGDMLALAYFRTYDMPVMISRCSNNYGSRQYPEKIIPFFIKRLMNGENATVYGDGSNVRDWLHVEDHCRAIDLVLHKGKPGEIYNIGDHNEKTNLETTKLLLEIIGLPEDRIEFIKDRPGHDIRYAIDSEKIRSELGWEPQIKFEEGFRDTVEWYKEYFMNELSENAPEIEITDNR